MSTPKAVKSEIAVITPANIHRTNIMVQGTSPLVQNKFSNKAKETMMKTMATEAGDKKSKAARSARNYKEDWLNAQHLTKDGMHGIPCVAIKAAMIRACKAAKVVMTDAKLALFIVPDGFDKDAGTPLIRLLKEDGSDDIEEPKVHEASVRNANGGTDIRVRPMWETWSAIVQIDFDADMISATSVVNLLDRAGKQVGVGEGRNFSTASCGQGWGSFQVVEMPEKKTKKSKK